MAQKEQEPSQSICYPAPKGADVEWEYEYDENETEDFYFTLDLTTHIPPLSRHRKPPPVTSSAENPPRVASSQPQEDFVPGEATRDADVPKLISAIGTAEAKPEHRIQLLDLHGDNPLISYESNLYSCHWASAIGTDLLFATSSTVRSQLAHMSVKPLHSTPKYDLIAATSARLIAKPVKLIPRVVPTPGNSLHPVTEISSAPVNVAYLGTSEPSNAPSSWFLKQRQDQTSFLKRLAAIKAARGETDKVPMHTRNYGQGRSQSIKKTSLPSTNSVEDKESSASDMEDEVDDEIMFDQQQEKTSIFSDLGQLAEEKGRGRGRRAKPRSGRGSRGPYRSKNGRAGGLFRDGQLVEEEPDEPQGTAGSHDKTVSVATPERWEDIERKTDRYRSPTMDNSTATTYPYGTDTAKRMKLASSYADDDPPRDAARILPPDTQAESMDLIQDEPVTPASMEAVEITQPRHSLPIEYIDPLLRPDV